MYSWYEMSKLYQEPRDYLYQVGAPLGFSKLTEGRSDQRAERRVQVNTVNLRWFLLGECSVLTVQPASELW